MEHIKAENLKTGKLKYFTETAWRNLQGTNIPHPYVKTKAAAGGPAKNLVGKTQVITPPKEVLDFKSKSAAAQAAVNEKESFDVQRDHTLFPDNEKGNAAWDAWVAENGGGSNDEGSAGADGPTGPDEESKAKTLLAADEKAAAWAKEKILADIDADKKEEPAAKPAEPAAKTAAVDPKKGGRR